MNRFKRRRELNKKPPFKMQRPLRFQVYTKIKLSDGTEYNIMANGQRMRTTW